VKAGLLAAAEGADVADPTHAWKLDGEAVVLRITGAGLRATGGESAEGAQGAPGRPQEASEDTELSRRRGKPPSTRPRSRRTWLRAATAPTRAGLPQKPRRQARRRVPRA
jgi:hypothetical protein